MTDIRIDDGIPAPKPYATTTKTNEAFRKCVLDTAKRIGVAKAAAHWSVSALSIRNWQKG